MNPRNQSWSRLLREEGPNFLAWIREQQVLSTKLDALATALSELLRTSTRTAEEADCVWNAVPDVLERCNEESTYDGFGSACAYAWIHLLDRYVRTWLVLERLVEKDCLPMAKFGISTLDVGAGPGPVAFAIHDFYTAMTEFSAVNGNSRWRQPPIVTCVESSRDTNHFRHILAEIVYDQSHREAESVLSMCYALPNFSEFEPTIERKQYWQALRSAVDEYFDDVVGQWTSEQRYLPDEANDEAQSLHRYRLIVFSYLLTTEDKVGEFEPNLVDVLHDAAPGSILLVIGAREGAYPNVYQYTDRLAKPAGFKRIIHGARVSSRDSEVADRVFEEGRLFYEFLQVLSQNKDEATKKVRDEFERRVSFKFPTSEIRVYRKQRYVKSNN